MCLWGEKQCIFRVSFLLTAVSQVGSRTPERQMEVLSQQFMRPVNVWKTVWRREKKWKEIHTRCAALAATGSTVCIETIHINTCIHAIIRHFDTTLRVEISRKPKRQNVLRVRILPPAASYLLPCRRGARWVSPASSTLETATRHQQKGCSLLAAIDTAWLVPVGSVERRCEGIKGRFREIFSAREGRVCPMFFALVGQYSSILIL